MNGLIHLGGGTPFRSEPSVTHPIIRFRKRYPDSTTESQNMTEFSVGWRTTFMILMGWPMSTKMNRMHMVTAEMARNSPRITILPNFL